MVDFWVNIDSGIFFLMQDVFVNAEFCKSTCGAGLVWFIFYRNVHCLWF